jgi:hypothetical protein
MEMNDLEKKKALSAIVELANKLAWKNPDLQVLDTSKLDQYSALSLIMQDHIKACHSRGKLVLPDLSAFDNQSVFIFSDYSGEGSGDYNTYSFLICAWNMLGKFQDEMAKLRVTTKLGDKEIAFKDFRMGSMQAALPQYLILLDNFVQGFLFTVVVDKGITTLFTGTEEKDKAHLVKALRDNNLGDWKPKTAEKLTRVVHIAAFLVALLVENEQKVCWVTDNDEICANEEMHKKLLELFCRAIGLYAGSESERMQVGGATPFKEKNIETLDLLSATDVVSSSIEHYLTKRDASSEDDFLVKGGSDKVLQWLGHDGISLRKMNIILRPMEEGMIKAATLEFKQKEIPENVIAIPVVI